MKFKSHKYLTLLIVVLLLFTGCTAAPNPTATPTPTAAPSNLKISDDAFMLDTYITITLYGTEDTSYFKEIFDTIDKLEKELSVHISTSELSLIKENAGIKPKKVSEDTFEIFEKAIIYSELSGGLFDITAGPLIDLWSIGTDKQRVPSQEEIDATIPLIDYRKIVLNKDESTVFLKDKNMYADLGAIAKGFIADKTAEKILSLGINSAIVNLGGNVLLVGSKPDGSLFNVGIQDPDETRGGYLGILAAKNLSVVTSGDYERYFIQDGIKYHHILDPNTGYPTNNNIKSVSIITDTSIDGDALSTTVLLLGYEKGLALINSLDNVEAIFITKENEIFLTDGVKDSFKLTSEFYKIMSN